jgi:tRNA dimethylallyltransferase
MSTQSKLISIVGTTATGKTNLALLLANKLLKQAGIKGVALISADSRQVYRGLEVLTGADVPSTFKPQSPQAGYRFFKHKQQPITLHGVSIIYPDQDWSVAHFREMTIALIKTAWENSWLPIVVGGTGLYHSQLFNNDPTLYIRPNQDIRQQATDMPVTELQAWLKKIDPNKIKNLNLSDRQNPRRLVRAIEVAVSLQQPTERVKHRLQFEQPKFYYQIGLRLPVKQLKPKIQQRVKQRFMLGAVKEVKNLLALDLPANSPPMTATGVKPIQDYLHHKITAQKTIEAWTQQEIQYAKQQLTWWQKHQPSRWLNPEQPDYQTQAWKIIQWVLNT